MVGTVGLDLAAAEGWIEGLVVPLSRGDGRIGLVSLAGRKKEPIDAAKAFPCVINVCLYSLKATGSGAFVIDGSTVTNAASGTIAAAGPAQ